MKLSPLSAAAVWTHHSCDLCDIHLMRMGYHLSVSFLDGVLSAHISSAAERRSLFTREAEWPVVGPLDAHNSHSLLYTRYSGGVHMLHHLIHHHIAL